MARNFKPNQAGFRELAVSAGVRRVLAEIAEKGKAYAEAISPYDVTPDDEGHYRDSFEVREETVHWSGRWPGPRAAARLQNTAAYAAAVEYGYEGRAAAPRVDAHRVLGRTLEWLESESKA